LDKERRTVGATSFEDLSAVNGKVCNTFTEAAEKLGLLKSDSMFYAAMQDACKEYSSGLKLIRYFAMLLIHAHPENPQKLFDAFLDQMFPPPAAPTSKDAPLPKDVRRRLVMRKLEYFLRTYEKSSK